MVGVAGRAAYGTIRLLTYAPADRPASPGAGDFSSNRLIDSAHAVFADWPGRHATAERGRHAVR